MIEFENGITLNGNWMTENREGGYRLSKKQMRELLKAHSPEIEPECVSCSSPHKTIFPVSYGKRTMRIGCTRFAGKTFDTIKKWANSK